MSSPKSLATKGLEEIGVKKALELTLRHKPRSVFILGAC